MADQAEEWTHRSVAAVYAEYFRLFSDAASTRLFDVLAHPDVVKVFGHRPDGDLTPLYNSVVEAVARSRACAEVSTAGWRKQGGELYPAAGLLAALRSRNVPIVISSDAHVVEHIGYGFDRAETIVRQVGYTSRCVFKKRRRTDIPL